MENAHHSHKPKEGVIEAAVETMRRDGFELIVELGNAVPHVDLIDIVGRPGTSPAFLSIVNTHFARRADNRYHYSLWAHGYRFNNAPTVSSGIADLPGRYSLVTLGAYAGGVGTFANQLGTFLHELGHNLGQRHGGADNATYKPNYLSVMNYFYQLTGFAEALPALGFARDAAGLNSFGFSHGTLPDLNENSLDERVGIGLGRAVDWNCNGRIDTAPVARDIQEPNWCTARGPRSVLSDFDNVGDMAAGIRTAAALRGAERDEPVEPCIGWDEHQAFLYALSGFERDELLEERRARAWSASEDGASFVIANDGTEPLTVQALLLDSAASWIGWSPRAPFTVAPGAQVRVSVEIAWARAPLGVSVRRLRIESNAGGEKSVSVSVNNVPGAITLTPTPTSSPASPTTTPLPQARGSLFMGR